MPVIAPCAPKAEPTTCFKIREVLGMSMCTEKMTDGENRRGRARSDEEISYQLRGKFGKSRDDRRPPSLISPHSPDLHDALTRFTPSP